MAAEAEAAKANAANAEAAKAAAAAVAEAARETAAAEAKAVEAKTKAEQKKVKPELEPSSITCSIPNGGDWGAQSKALGSSDQYTQQATVNIADPLLVTMNTDFPNTPDTAAQIRTVQQATNK